MAWRGVHISEAARLSLANGQIVAARADGEVRLAIEDVAWIVIDTPQVSLSTALVSACMEAGIVLVITDHTHMPSGVILPFHRHHRQAGVAAMQIAVSAPIRKRLWQAVVQAKIGNQAALLQLCGGDAAPLRAMVRLVGSGDPDNTEARAARHYWSRLFPDFVRDDAADRRNGLLNYGYAVLRSACARALVGAGLLPALGIHHASIVNPFNLADDLIEAFRPFVDHAVWEITRENTSTAGESTVAERRRLASLLAAECRSGGEVVSLLVATERAADSLVRSMDASSPALLMFPHFAA